MGLFNNIINYLALSDVSEKNGKGAAYLYLKQLLNESTKAAYYQANDEFEKNKQRLVTEMTKIYNEHKEIYDKDFCQMFFRIMSTYALATVDNIESIDPFLDIIIPELTEYAELDSVLNQIKEAVNKNQDNQKINENKEKILKLIDEIKTEPSLKETKNKLLSSLSKIKEYGIYIENEEELIEKCNLKNN